jgi:hypothetical protein
MYPCEHAAWLEVSRNNPSLQDTYQKDSIVVHDTDRFRKLVDDLPTPHSQRPTLTFFQGRKDGLKDKALRQLFPNNNIKRNRTGGIINVRADYISFGSENPILFADGNVDTQIRPSVVLSACHPTTSYPITWQCPNSQTATDVILTRIVLPLCSAYFLFADDFDSTEQILGQLVRWATLEVFSTLPEGTRPRLTLVYTASEEGLKVQDLRALTVNGYVQEMFPHITLFPLDNRLSIKTRFHALRDHAKKDIDLAKCSRARSNWLFSATHLYGLFQASLQHVSKTITQGFDPIAMTREHSAHDGSLDEHIHNFLEAGVKYSTAYDDITTYIASSFLMDSYPLGSHSKFVL